jgi:hypothetical protein
VIGVSLAEAADEFRLRHLLLADVLRGDPRWVRVQPGGLVGLAVDRLDGLAVPVEHPVVGVVLDLDLLVRARLPALADDGVARRDRAVVEVATPECDARHLLRKHRAPRLVFLVEAAADDHRAGDQVIGVDERLGRKIFEGVFLVIVRHHSILSFTVRDSRPGATGAETMSSALMIRAVAVVPSLSVKVKLYFAPTTIPRNVMKFVRSRAAMFRQCSSRSPSAAMPLS